MREHLIYCFKETGELSTDTTRVTVPVLQLPLGAWLKLKIGFLAAGGVLTSLANDTPVSFVLKKSKDYSGDALALDIIADTVTESGITYYRLKAQIDSEDLRTLLANADSLETRLTLSWGEGEDQGRSVLQPVVILASANLGDEAAPDPLDNAAEDWLITQVPAITAAIEDLQTEQVEGLDAALAAKADLVSGKVPTDQLPSIAITNTFVVANEAAMLALTAQTGDLAKRTDNSRMYVLAAEPASTLSNWVLFEVPATGVQSVNGLTGNEIVLAKSNIGLSNVENYGIASQAEAEAGSSAVKYMTPQRVAQAIAALSTGRVLAGQLNLVAHTTAGTAASGPPDLVLDFAALSGGDAIVQISYAGTDYVVSMTSVDPSDGSTWVDSTSFGSGSDYATAFAGALAVSGLSVSADAALATVTSSETGADKTLSGTVLSGMFSITGGGSGTDETPGSGGTSTVTFTAPAGKTVRLIGVFAQVPSGYNGVKLTAGGDDASNTIAGLGVQVTPKLDTAGGWALRTAGVSSFTLSATELPTGEDDAVLYFTYQIVG
ncbi:MAG: hypothetical protein JNJ83_10900 [Verrucomicrobiaceae bacterium]|nr:hypothetical protein [Verrucomicrobiaceae bacterium]